MPENSLYINSSYIYINIESWDETQTITTSEKAVVINPANYDAPNTIIYASGHQRQTFNINGYTSISNRSSIIDALKNNTKVYPSIYPDGTNNIIVQYSYYYITNVTGYFQNNDSNWHFNITLKYGGI